MVFQKDYYYFLEFLVYIPNINAFTEIRMYLHLSKCVILNNKSI
jgi:hypothetical protein